jgi:hypothetical protein
VPRTGSVVVASVVSLCPLTAWTLQTSPRDIAANPDRFDGRVVTVNGTVAKVDARVSRRGNEVEGRFQRAKRVGRDTFHDEIDATRVHCQ